MELRKSEVAGLYNILKEGQNVKTVAYNCQFTESYVRQMFNGHRTMSKGVWNEALKVADKYLNDLKNDNNRAKNLIAKHEKIKTA